MCVINTEGEGHRHGEPEETNARIRGMTDDDDSFPLNIGGNERKQNIFTVDSCNISYQFSLIKYEILHILFLKRSIYIFLIIIILLKIHDRI